MIELGEEYSVPASPAKITSSQRRKKNKKSRRFSNEQIRSLESLFKMEAKLETRKKLQMARELGLQPRQVAIWFQNKRARWKSKQIEHEYRSLKADFDELNSRFESLKKEKHSLLIQLNKLRDQLNTPRDGRGGSKDLEGNSTDSGSENGGTNFQLKGNSSSLSGPDPDMVMYSDDEERRNTGYLAKREEAEFQSVGKQVDDFSAPPEKLCRFDSDGLFDQPCGTSNWWDFWT